MNETTTVDGRALCDRVEAQCRCREDAAHEGAHVCPCGGSWTYDEAGRFEVVEWPSPYPIEGLEAGADW